MYAEYAKDPRMRLNLGIRRRLAPLLDNGRDEMELLMAILFSLPGSPVLYYGDEIGMGDNVYLGDRDGVRTPMQWTGDRNGGFSRADFARLYLPPLMDPVYGFQAVNVEAQLRTPTSLLRWVHRYIALRKEHPVFALGTYEPLRTENERILAHIRRHEDEIVLCAHNLSRSPAAGRARSIGVFWVCTRGDALAYRVSPDRRAPVSPHLRGPRVLLVPAPEARGMNGPAGVFGTVPERRDARVRRLATLVRREEPRDRRLRRPRRDRPRLRTGVARQLSARGSLQRRNARRLPASGAAGIERRPRSSVGRVRRSGRGGPADRARGRRRNRRLRTQAPSSSHPSGSSRPRPGTESVRSASSNRTRRWSSTTS